MAKTLKDYFPMIRSRKEVLAEIERRPELLNEFDTGLKLNTLQKYVLISLDIFRECKHNKDIKDELDAWLSFLCFDEPEEIIRLIEAYPEFKAMYEEIYQMCLNIEGVMNMFSPELREIDRNTVQYMIEEQEKRLEEQNKALKENAEKLEEQDKKLRENAEELEAKKEELETKKEELETNAKELEAKDAEIAALKEALRKAGL